LKAARENYVSNFLGESIKENPKRFWSYVKKLNKDDVGISDFEVNGEFISDRKCKSELLSKHFSSVFTHENISNMPKIPENPNPSINPPCNYYFYPRGCCPTICVKTRQSTWTR
jgi:hypothetical protein